MRILGQTLSDGNVRILDAPDPNMGPGQVRVSTLFSAVSPGTEGGKVKTGKQSLLAKARLKPERALPGLATFAMEESLETGGPRTVDLDAFLASREGSG